MTDDPNHQAIGLTIALVFGGIAVCGLFIFLCYRCTKENYDLELKIGDQTYKPPADKNKVLNMTEASQAPFNADTFAGLGYVNDDVSMK